MDAGVAVLIALIALVGVLIGAILTARGIRQTLDQNAQFERERWARQDSRRHEEARRTAYPAFLATVDEGVEAIHQALRNGSPLPDMAWRQRLYETLSVIESVGSPLTIDLAQRFHQAVRRLHRAATAVLNPRSRRPWATKGSLAMLDRLPYPLGGDVSPEKMYGGNPMAQVVMAQSELRVRRQEYLNAARADIGMGEVPFPEDWDAHLKPIDWDAPALDQDNPVPDPDENTPPS